MGDCPASHIWLPKCIFRAYSIFVDHMYIFCLFLQSSVYVCESQTSVYLCWSMLNPILAMFFGCSYSFQVWGIPQRYSRYSHKWKFPKSWGYSEFSSIFFSDCPLWTIQLLGTPLGSESPKYGSGHTNHQATTKQRIWNWENHWDMKIERCNQQRSYGTNTD